MLSYLKDGQSQTPAAEAAQDSQTSQDDGLCQKEDFLTVSGHAKKVRQSTLMLIGLFVVGGAVVWFMVKKITPANADAAAGTEQSQLESALAQLKTMKTEVNTHMDTVVGRFYQFDNLDQVEVSELKKNPFQRELGRAQKKVEAEDKLKDIRESARRQAAEMELWSITATPRGKCCMINDKLLYVGDTLNDMTVQSIDDKTVQLEYNGVYVELKMTE